MYLDFLCLCQKKKKKTLILFPDYDLIAPSKSIKRFITMLLLRGILYQVRLKCMKCNLFLHPAKMRLKLLDGTVHGSQNVYYFPEKMYET